MAMSVIPDQTAPIGSVCSGSTLFACILKFASIAIKEESKVANRD